MGDEIRFSQKWDFRRKENSSDDSSSENPESNSSHDQPILKKHKLVAQPDKGKTTATGASNQQPGKTRKSSSKKGGAKPGNAKKTGRTTRKTARGEGVKTKKRKRATGKREPADDSVNGVGAFMEALLDDLKASRESLFGWMSAEICKLDGDNEPASSKKETRTRKEGERKAQPRRSKRTAKNKKVPEGEKENSRVQEENQKEEQTKPEKKVEEKNNVEKETENVCAQGQELCNVGFDCNVGPLEGFLRSGEAGHGRNYFQQQKDQERGDRGQFMRLMTSNDEETAKSWGPTSMQKQKSLVLGIRAQNCGLGTPERPSRCKKTAAEASSGQTRDVTRVESTVLSSETQKDRNFETPIEPKLSSSLLMPVVSSLCSSFPSNHGIAYFASNHVQPRPVLSQIQDSPDIHSGSGFAHQGLRNLNCLYQNNGYFPGFLSSDFNFPTENSQRDNNGNMLGGLRMSGGAIRFSGGLLPEHFSSANINNNISDYRTSSGRQMQFQTQNITGGNVSRFQS